MSSSAALLPEFEHEMATTRRMLELVPEDNLAWKPHEKSMTLGRLASHLAEIPHWGAGTFLADSVDIMPTEGEAPITADLGSKAAILELFDRNLAAARDALGAASDESFGEMWSLLRGGQTLLRMPRGAVMRSLVMNHAVHHRAQLGVYLRMNDVALPSTYGPTADEASFMEA